MQVYTPKPRERAMEQIEAYILQNGLKAGDSLPPEREMCRMWDLNRSTLRSAIARLEASGRLVSVQGSGTRLTPRFRRTLQDLQSFTEYARDGGFRPETRLLSFSKKQMTWDIANSVRERDFFGWIELPPVDDEEAQSFTKRMKEEIRAEVEKEIDERKIAEFEWLSPLITRQVTDVLKLALNKPDAQVSVLEEGQSDENFIDFGNFYQQISDGKPIQ